MPLAPAALSTPQLSLFDDTPAPGLGGAALSPAAARFFPAPGSRLAGSEDTAAPALSPPLAPSRPTAPPPPAAVSPAAGGVFLHPRAQREIHFGSHRVAYELRRASRRSIGFTVGSEGLSVSAPRWVGVAEVEAVLRERANWILRKLHEQGERSRRLNAARVEWVDGAELPYLGEKIRLRLNPGTRGAVLREDLQPKELHLGLPQGASAEQLREAVQSWLQRQARALFEQRCAEFAPRLGVQMKRLSLSSAATRWGSASANGHIRLNWRLVHFALPVIDYVVTHELAHLREMNHSAAFWDVVRSVMPGYEQAQGVLRTEVLPVFS
ncbi:MAG: M48 family metallopeptidase [Rubrivivax sp.]|jgi:predicted metal-dependent hydrolase